MNTKTFQALAAQSVITTDVLVLGGGPAGTWAALSAAKQGARVVLADKGYCGTSGATAPSNTGGIFPKAQNVMQKLSVGCLAHQGLPIAVGCSV
jgi:2-polyprenyl-6-methoxyphenol hydroxylase-like FAD-dependent oxidoreductase